MNLAMPVFLFALIRNGLAMGQYYHKARRENRKPALPPRSRLTPRSRSGRTYAGRVGYRIEPFA